MGLSKAWKTMFKRQGSLAKPDDVGTLYHSDPFSKVLHPSSCTGAFQPKLRLRVTGCVIRLRGLGGYRATEEPATIKHYFGKH
jgi:hypothetical protein